MSVKVTREIKVGRPIKITEDTKDKIVIDYNNGQSTSEIADRYAICVQSVRKILRERK